MYTGLTVFLYYGPKNLVRSQDCKGGNLFLTKQHGSLRKKSLTVHFTPIYVDQPTVLKRSKLQHNELSKDLKLVSFYRIGYRKFSHNFKKG